MPAQHRRSSGRSLRVGACAGVLAACACALGDGGFASGGDFKLTSGEKPDASNRFSSPTFLRLDDRKEVIRLAPGLVAVLNRPADYYQQFAQMLTTIQAD